MLDVRANFTNFVERKHSGTRLAWFLVVLATLVAIGLLFWGWKVSSNLASEAMLIEPKFLSPFNPEDAVVSECLYKMSEMIMGFTAVTCGMFLLVAFILSRAPRFTSKLNAFLSYIQTPEGQEHLARHRSDISD